MNNIGIIYIIFGSIGIILVTVVILSLLIDWAGRRADKSVKEKRNKILTMTSDVEKASGKITKHKKFKSILDLVELRQNALLYGPSGSGKNFVLSQVCEVLNLEFYYQPPITDEYQVRGYKDALGQYNSTTFYRWAIYGGVFMLDEMDASNPEALVAINAALANGYMSFANGELIYLNENCVFIGAANTNLSGEDIETYTARNKIDAATIDRFWFINFDYDVDLERKLLENGLKWLAKDQIDTWYKFILEIRRIVKDSNIGTDVIISTRQFRNITTLLNGYREKFERENKTRISGKLISNFNINQEQFNFYLDSSVFKSATSELLRVIKSELSKKSDEIFVNDNLRELFSNWLKDSTKGEEIE